MLCRNPFVKGALVVPCGQCLPCRVSRRRVWTHRLMLEAETCGSSSCFLTLTYRDPPVGPPRGNLDPRDVTLFLKRLRARVWPAQVRYYAVGEYGELTHRPHYHLALFGVGPEDELSCERSWGRGFISVLPLCQKTAAYVVGYVTKKFDTGALPGRIPPFARMSTHPGLGAGAVPAIASIGTTDYGSRQISIDRDVPAVLRQGQTLMPLGRYLRGRLRLEHGADRAELPEARAAEWRALMFAVRRAAGNRFKHRSCFMEDDKASAMEAREEIRKVRRL